MSIPNEKEDFLQDVLSFIKFPFDRQAIRNELEGHIDDQAYDYIQDGLPPKEAIHKAIIQMGSPSDIGRELNQMHRPLVGWIWKLSDMLVKTLSVIVLLAIIMQILLSINLNSPSSFINQDQIVYHLKPNESRQIDDEIIKITDIIYDKKGTLFIFYKTYSDNLFINLWTTATLGDITDELGNNYFGGGSSSGGFIRHNIVQINGFNKAAKELHIHYDYYHRHYEFYFDLPRGDAYE